MTPTQIVIQLQAAIIDLQYARADAIDHFKSRRTLDSRPSDRLIAKLDGAQRAAEVAIAVLEESSLVVAMAAVA
jgi:hypothetical protein